MTPPIADIHPLELRVIRLLATWAYGSPSLESAPRVINSTTRILEQAGSRARHSAYRRGIQNVLAKEVKAGIRAGTRDIKSRWVPMILASDPESLESQLALLAREGIRGPVWRGRHWGFTTWIENSDGKAAAHNRGQAAVVRARARERS